MNELPVCAHCQQQWSYPTTLKSLFRLRCSYCGNKNFFSRDFRYREPIFLLGMMLVNMFLLPMLPISFTYKTCIVLLMLILYIGTLPFGLKLSAEEEPYF